MYDDIVVRRLTGDELAVSNGIASGSVPARAHKVVLIGTGSNVVSVDVHDSASTGTVAEIKISVASNERVSGVFSRFTEASFNPPVRFEDGVSFNLTGANAVVYFHYSLT